MIASVGRRCGCRACASGPTSGVTGDDTRPGFDGLTIGDARRRLAQALAVAGREPAAVEARLLVAAATGLDHAALLREADRPIGDAATRLSSFAVRRLGGEPVSRILGFREFSGLTLAVRPGVLDPREDTETVVRLALDLCPDRAAPLRIVDLGTGSGALLCALLAALPHATGTGVDLSPLACDAALANVRAAGVAERAMILRGRWAEALAGPFDLIVSNPPYIESAALPGLPVEVRDHDPALALDGGSDGLDVYRALVVDARRIAAPGAHLVFELGAGQREAVEALFRQARFALAGARQDGGGHARAIAARIA